MEGGFGRERERERERVQSRELGTLTAKETDTPNGGQTRVECEY